MEKIQVHNLIILDESGSMESIKDQIISGFNETIQTIRQASLDFPDQQHFVSFYTFNGTGIKRLHFIDDAKKIGEIDFRSYNPNASTPLYDTMGRSMNDLKAVLKDSDPDSYRVLVTIFTDGYENASKEYRWSAVKALIEELKKQNWTFAYIGTDHDVESISESLSINSSIAFDKSAYGTQTMFERERDARRKYYERVSKREKNIDNLFDEDPDNQK